MSRHVEDDLFAEEQSMPTMSFGDHIEELRHHLIFALAALVVGVLITFMPPLYIGKWVFATMEEPARQELDKFYKARADKRAKEAEAKKEWTATAAYKVDLVDFAGALRTIAPDLKIADPAALKGKTITVQMAMERAKQILDIAGNMEQRDALISLAPMETFSIFFFVCIVTGLVLSSPVVFWQIWAFIGAGLYRHERFYVKKFLPLSLGLFLGGVLLCFFQVLPWTLEFLLQFNVWLGIEPTLRISEWIGFATILPLIFGICFQTPLVMLIIERIGIMSADDFRAKRKYAIVVMVIAAAVITPTQDPISLGFLAIPMIVLYEVGLLLIGTRKKHEVPTAVA